MEISEVNPDGNVYQLKDATARTGLAQIEAQNTYATTEMDTGKKWIDGKKIYRRCFIVTSAITILGGNSQNFLNIPGFSSQYVNDVLPTLNEITNLRIICSRGVEGIRSWGNVILRKNNGYIGSYANPGINYIGFDIPEGSIVVLEYTKSI